MNNYIVTIGALGLGLVALLTTSTQGAELEKVIKHYNENQYTEQIAAAVERYSQKYKIDKYLILAIIQNESNFRPGALGSAGEKGLMQISEIAFDEVNRVYPEEVAEISYQNINEVEANIKAGVLYFKRVKDYYDGNVYNALAAYNGGFNNPNYSYSDDVLEVKKQMQRL